MSENIYALVLAGGRGSRFWPLSRNARPKQCLALDGGESLLSKTVARVGPLVDPEHVLVLTGPAMETPVREALPQLKRDAFLVEPSARNTAPCIGWGAVEVARRGGEDAVVVVLPADHRIGDEERFRAALSAAADLAQSSGDIVTLGIRPTRPETGYGYLELGGAVAGAPMGARTVQKFCEKPAIERAREWSEDGEHLWNGGIFVFRVDAMLREFERHLSGTGAALRRLQSGSVGLPEVWEDLEATSIDYGVMERSDRILTIPIDVEWSDLGDWEAVGQHLPQIEGGRGLCAAALAQDASDCVVHAPGKVVALVGVHDLVVVSTGDAILVMPRARAQDARVIPGILEDLGLKKYT